MARISFNFDFRGSSLYVGWLTAVYQQVICAAITQSSHQGVLALERDRFTALVSSARQMTASLGLA